MEFVGLSFIATVLALLLAQGLEALRAPPVSGRKYPTRMHDGSDHSATRGESNCVYPTTELGYMAKIKPQ